MTPKMTKAEFAAHIVPNFEKRYEIYKCTPKELIGRKVVSIRSGFSSIGGGTEMMIDNADEIDIHLIPTENSKDMSTLGWGCKYNERYNSFIFIK